MEIVKYSSKYKKEVRNLIFSILKELGSPPAPKEHSDKDLENIEKVYSGRGRFWIALSGNKVIGTVGIKEIDKDRAKLKRMFVAKKFRGKGVAQELLKKAQEFAKRSGYKEIELWTSHAMRRAQNFYEKNGYKLVDKNKWARRYTKNLR